MYSFRLRFWLPKNKSHSIIKSLLCPQGFSHEGEAMNNGPHGDMFDVNASRDNRARGLWKGVVLAMVFFFATFICTGNFAMWVNCSLVWALSGILIQVLLLTVSHNSESSFDQLGGTVSQIYHGFFGLLAPLVVVLVIIIRLRRI